MHPFLHRAPEVASPTSIVFDLDPGIGEQHRQNNMLQFADLVKANDERLRRELNNVEVKN